MLLLDSIFMPDKLWIAAGSVLLVLAIALPQQKSEAGSRNVPAGGDLQDALDNARPGDTIYLEPGVTYVGNFVLRPRGGSDSRPTTIRTAGVDVVAPGERMAPEQAATLAKLRSPNNLPALATAPQARGWRIELVEFLANRGGAGDIVAFGDGSADQKTAATVPSDLALDRVYMHGDEQQGQKRAVALNAARVTITNSYISDIKAIGQDSQAIAGWNGPGDYLIENNYLEAAGENLLFGGSDPAILELTPTNITIRRNTVVKPLAWREPGARWQVKNLLELKNARNVVIEDNLFERNWSQAQSGYAILFTVANQDGNCPWCEVSDVRFQGNTVRDVAAGFQLAGGRSQRARNTENIVIRDNVFDGLDGRAWGGDGYLLQVTDSPRNITIDHNTVIQGDSSGIAKIDGRVDGFTFTNNITGYGAYGIIASGRAPGNDSIQAVLPGSRISGNVIIGGNESTFPPGNLFSSLEELRRQFVNFTGRDFRLRDDSAWIKGGIDGRPIGADLRARARVPSRVRTP
jgi:hypothetical protein